MANDGNNVAASAAPAVSDDNVMNAPNGNMNIFTALSNLKAAAELVKVQLDSRRVAESLDPRILEATTIALSGVDNIVRAQTQVDQERSWRTMGFDEIVRRLEAGEQAPDYILRRFGRLPEQTQPAQDQPEQEQHQEHEAAPEQAQPQGGLLDSINNLAGSTGGRTFGTNVRQAPVVNRTPEEPPVREVNGPVVIQKFGIRVVDSTRRQ